MEYNIYEIQDKLKKLQNKRRFLHTLGVQYTAANMAMCHGCHIKQAEVAGLLHDCAKYMKEDTILEKCRKHKIEVSPFEERNAFLLHAKLGAFYAKTKYNVEDEDILNAITYHTTGRPDMSVIEKIVFIADYIEPSRPVFEGLDIIRKAAYTNLDKTMYLVLKKTLEYLAEDRREIDRMTNKSYEYYKNYAPKGI